MAAGPVVVKPPAPGLRRYRRNRSVATPHSSRQTYGRTSRSGCHNCHWRRAAGTSGWRSDLVGVDRFSKPVAAAARASARSWSSSPSWARPRRVRERSVGLPGGRSPWCRRQFRLFDGATSALRTSRCREPRAGSVPQWSVGRTADLQHAITLMDLVIAAGDMTLQQIKEPTPNVKSIPSGSVLGVGVSMAGGGAGDVVRLVITAPTGATC
jgi:hypothetical protein